jgi:hypothetical protein
MELSFSRHRDHKWKIPAQNGPKNRRHVTSLSGLECAVEITGSLNFDCALWAFELMAVRVDEILEERHAIAGHRSFLIGHGN